jgi:putative membrane protein
MEAADDEDLDYRFSLANERTFLAWIRTSLALVAGGVAAAKALHFNHETWRWIVSAPPVALGSALAVEAVFRWRTYESRMRAGARLPVGRGLAILGFTLAIYAVVALFATILDG